MIIFHIDVNSAYLSWESAYRLQFGKSLDLRTVPSAIGGDPQKRTGIILAKSIPAKKYGIKTGESLYNAYNKCPDLIVAPPNYDLYIKCSNAMFKILCEYSPLVQRYSVDECFLDYTNSKILFGEPLKIASTIKKRIKNELGFTVNIGISTNKLLAKMASKFEKPDKIHTLFPNEIKSKMWPLPIEELFMVGKSTSKKLRSININTIGDLANSNIHYIKCHLKSHGVLIWNYANGIDDSKVRESNYIVQKGIGNSTTIPFDIDDKYEAYLVLLSLAEKACMRLRNLGYLCSKISISIKSTYFRRYSHQSKLLYYLDDTSKIFKIIKKLFNESWQGEPIRQLGIRLSELCTNDFYQISIYDFKDKEKYKLLNKSIDNIRKKYGNNSIIRGSFIHSRIPPINGGVGEEDYPMMSSLL